MIHVGEQERDRLASNRAATVGVHGRHAAADLLLLGRHRSISAVPRSPVSRCWTAQPPA
jgi:hypothetical protein